MAAPNPQPHLLTFQTMYLCGVAYNADPAVMPNLIQNTQKPPTGGNWLAFAQTYGTNADLSPPRARVSMFLPRGHATT